MAIIQAGDALAPRDRIALAGIPWDENSSYLRGPAEAPPLIRAALFSEASGLRSESGVDFSRTDFVDEGDVPIRSGLEMLAEIERFIGALLSEDFRPISLGGDHAVTYPIMKAFHKKYRDLTILQFDAHSDLYDIFEGNRYSHACPFARIMEEGLARRLVQVGVRTLDPHQRAQAARFGVEIIEMKDWRAGREVTLTGPVYLSFDLDALDPAFAPGVSHHEPGGFTTREVIDALMTLEADVVGADLVEFNPRRDVGDLTANLVAKLVKEIAGLMLASARVK
ncbi:MAG: agmatinase [Spartobacteria bacterium]